VLFCKKCKKEVYSTINDKCSNCYYNWEGLDLSFKIGIIILVILFAIQFTLILIGLIGG
jgi:hypothetical protein